MDGQDYKKDHNSDTYCRSCRTDTPSGTHNGCGKCGRVKHNIGGRKNLKK